MNIEKRYKITLLESEVIIISKIMPFLSNEDWVLLYNLRSESMMNLTQLNSIVKILERYVNNYLQIKDILTDLYRITEHEQ